MSRSALGIISWDCASGVAPPGGSTGVYIYDVVIIYHYRIAIAIASNSDVYLGMNHAGLSLKNGS